MAHLLMIDDNPQNQRYIGKILRYRSPHEIVFVPTCQDAIEQIVERRPDLIFLDLFTPGTDGFEFLESLHTHPATKGIPVVVHSGVPFDPLTALRLKRMRPMYEGVVEFPIDASELNRTIEAALTRSTGSVHKWAPPTA